MAGPHVSVVVPTHDTRALTLACLRALARDLPADAEVIVVDDRSRDGTAAAIAQEFPVVRVLTLKSGRGFTAAANAGLAVATGDVRLLLNSDTEVAPGALARLRAAFADQPRLGAAGAALVFPDGRPQWSGGRAPNARWLFALASGVAAFADRVPGYRRWRPVAGQRGPVDWVPGAALALRVEAWRAVGPFDGSLLLYGQDLDLCLRLRAAGWQIAVVREARVMHHGGATIAGLPGATAARQQPELLWIDLLRVVAKHGGSDALVAAARALRRGAALRLALRRAALPFVPASRRAAWRADTASYERARAAVVAFASVA